MSQPRSPEIFAGLEPVSPAPRKVAEQVWLAVGLHLPWRVCSDELTYGEFERVADAYAFLGLLLEGNPHLRPLS